MTTEHGGPGGPGDSSWLVGGGRMGDEIRSRDWSGTPLGPIGSWEPELRSALSLALQSSVPISLIWGPEHIEIYNDPFRPLTGNLHQVAFGADFTKTWKAMFPLVGDAFYTALSGRAASLENLQIFLDRHGFTEETYFTISFSPIRNRHGQVAGLFHPVTETTGQIIADRRARALHELATRPLVTRSLEDELDLVAGAIAEFGADVPFALFYRLAEAGETVRLVSCRGLDAGHPAAGPVDLGAGDSGGTGPVGWPLRRAVREGAPVYLDDVQHRFPGLSAGPHGDRITAAVLLPVPAPGHQQPACLAVLGISPRLPLDQSYRAFHELIRSSIGSTSANIGAFEAERHQALALAEVDRSKTAFFSNVSHEFRTPLTLLLGPLEEELADRAADPAASPLGRQRLEMAHRNALRLVRLVSTLLDFARMDAGRLHATFEPVDLAALTSDVAATFRGACERAALELEIDCRPLPEPVWADRELWEAIVLNLLSNAFNFTGEGRITVRLAATGDDVRLDVADSGVGMPEDELSRVFDRFHRVPGTRGRTDEGTGLGLAFVRELARQHGGSASGTSTPGQGSTFTVRIPFGRAHLPAERLGEPTPVPPAAGARAAEPARGIAGLVEEAATGFPENGGGEPELVTPWVVPEPAPPEPGARLVPAPRDGEPAGRPRIVWADDNADLRDYVRRLLSDEYEVETVADGLAALEAVRRRPPALVLSDTTIPGLNGLDLLRTLRDDPATSTVPVLLLSAGADEESRIQALTAGADDYLVKPFSSRELLARVAAHIQLGRLRRDAEAARSVIDRAAATAVSEAMLRLITDSVPAMICYVGADGRYRFANRVYQEWLGKAPEDMIGKHINDVWEDLGDLMPWLEQALAGQRQVDVAEVPNGLGGSRYVQGTYVPDLAPGGEVRGMVGLAWDVTELVHRRLEVARVNEELEQRVAQRTAELNATNKELEAFAYSVSHDLRAPLRAIDGFTRILLEDFEADLPAEAQRYFGLVRDNAQRMGHLIDELLAFARLSRGVLRRQAFDHVELVRACAQEACAAEPDRRIEVAVGELPTCDADPALVRQVWQNLLGNAVKYSRRQDRARIEVRCESAEQAVGDGVVAADGTTLEPADVTGPVYVIEDNGAGFDMRYLGKLFGVFQRLHRSDDYEGTGVGLAIVERIVNRHGGRIWAWGEVDHGARFSFTLGEQAAKPAAHPGPARLSRVSDRPASHR